MKKPRLGRALAIHAFALALVALAAGVPNAARAQSQMELARPGGSEPPARAWIPARAQAVPVLGSAASSVSFRDVAQPRLPALSGPQREEFLGTLVPHQGEGTARSTRQLLTPPPPMPAASMGSGPYAPGELRGGFDGISQTAYSPPDTQIAVGPGYVMEAVNEGFAIYDKRGVQIQGYATFDTFFASLLPGGWAGSISDPKLLWSRGQGRFTMLVNATDFTNHHSYLFYAISKTSDPTGDWWLYSWVNPDDLNSFLDFASWGTDSSGVYMAANRFTWTYSQKDAIVLMFSPCVFYGCSPVGWYYQNLAWPDASKAYELQVATPLTVNGNGETFLVNDRNSSGNTILVWKIGAGDRGDPTTPPALSKVELTLSFTYTPIGQNVTQPGSSTKIGGGDCRVLNVVYDDRHLFATFTTDPVGDANQSGIGWADLDVNTNTVAQSGVIWYGAGVYFIYPAVAAFGDPQVPPMSLLFAFSYTWPSSTTYGSVAYWSFTNYPTDTTGPFGGLFFGADSYDQGGTNRWGDYSGAATDSFCRRLWGAGEYAGTSNTWKTGIFSISTDAGPTIFTDGFESGFPDCWSSVTP